MKIRFSRTFKLFDTFNSLFDTFFLSTKKIRVRRERTPGFLCLSQEGKAEEL